MAKEKRQRQKQKRAARLEAERKAAQRARRIRTARNLLIVVVVVFGLAFLFSVLSGGGDDEPQAATTTADPNATTTTLDPALAPTSPSYALFASQETGCAATAPPAPANLTFDDPIDQAIAGDATVTAVISTSCGDITLELDPAAAPTAVNSFVFLARQNFWNGAPIHRIAELPGRIIQFGDPTGTGAGGPGYTFEDELPPEGTPYGPGVLAMANGGPNTNGSQFFLTVGDTPLSNDFTIFGSFAVDQAAITDILAVPLGLNAAGEPSRPLESVYIESVGVTVAP